MGGRDYLNNEEVDFLFDTHLSGKITPIEMPMPNVEENKCISLQYAGLNKFTPSLGLHQEQVFEPVKITI